MSQLEDKIYSAGLRGARQIASDKTSSLTRISTGKVGEGRVKVFATRPATGVVEIRPATGQGKVAGIVPEE